MGTKASTVLLLLLLALIALTTTNTLAKKVDPEQKEQHAHGGQQSKQLKECQTQCERQSVPAQQKQVCSKQCVEKFSERQQQEEAKGKKRQDQEGKGKKRQNPWQEEEEWEGREEEEEEEGSNPYVFEQHHFQSKVRETEHGRVSFLPKFTKRSKLFRGLQNFRFGLLEADPQTFIVPTHYDAEAFLIVAAGRGTITMIQEKKRRTLNVKQGDIIRVPAGTPVYGTNQDENDRLYIVKLLQPVNSPGEFEIYNGAGGQNPESFFNAFSGDLLEAAFQTDRSELERLLEQQQEGPIVKASKEQIQALSGGSGSDSKANDNDDTPAIWPFGDTKGSKESKGKGKSSSSSDLKFNLFNKSPSFSNQYGQLFIVDKDDFKQLQGFDLAISYANITKGSMLGPYFNSRSTKISIVLDGEGYIEMACPHLAKQQQQQPWSTDPYRRPYQGHQGRSTDPYQSSPYQSRQGRSTDPYQSSPYEGRQGRWSEPRHQGQEQERWSEPRHQGQGQERWSEPRHQGQEQERWSEPRHQGQEQERWSERRHQRQEQWPRHQGQEQEETSFQQVRARLSRGTVFITPAGHPAAAVASRDSNLQIVCFEVNADNNVKYPLTGKNNVVGLMEKEAQELAFNFPSKDVERIFKAQSEQFFFPGPKRQQEGRGGGYAADE